MMNKLFGRRKKVTKYAPMMASRERWETEYAEGQWDCLKGIGQLAHYSVITGYAHYLKPGGSVLDLGCGEGVLHAKIRPYGYSRYVGVDFSAEAIKRASGQNDDKTSFLRGDITTFDPRGRFDAVIFNESLCHLDDPIGVLRRYEGFMEPDGVLIVSLFGTEVNERLWEMIDRAYPVMDMVRIAHPCGLDWTVKVFGPGEKEVPAQP